MGWSAAMCFLILLKTETYCTNLLGADNTIVDINNDMNDTSIVINFNETETDNNNMDNNNSVITSIAHLTSPDTTTTSKKSIETSSSFTTSTESDSTSSSKTPDDIGGVAPPVLSVEEIEGLEVENVVETTHGEVKGFKWRESDLLAFIDIPYGMFEGYFKPPVPPKAWKHVHQVTEHTKRCPQIIDNKYVGDNDCLTLSIFVPPNAVNASVLFHIHESHFASGSGDPAKYGPEYLVPRGVILVLPNYRLGALGFLCLRNETAPGNAALKDLTLALEWTRQNIYSFGGDPHDITLSGDGTAGSLVGYLALSSKSRTYINKAITESGSVLSHWAIDRNPDATADELAKKIRKREEELDKNSFDEAEIATIVTAAQEIELMPCIEEGEDAFLDKTPWEMLHETFTTNITFMIGSANLAGAIKAFSATEDMLQHLNKDFSEVLPSDLHFRNQEERVEIGKRLRELYFEDNVISVENKRPLALCYTDCSYLGPGIRTARSLIRAGFTVYLYEFSFVGSLNRESMAIDKNLDGAVKGDLVGYLFTQDGFVPPPDTEEQRIVNLMADLWASFIKTGQPKAEDIEWDPLTSSDDDSEEVYLSIAAKCVQKRGIHVDRIRLWTEIYDEHFIERNNVSGRNASLVTALVALMLSIGLC